MTDTMTGPLRLLAARADSYAEHVRAHGELPSLDAGHLVDLVHESGLTGRGGAAFPSGRKLATVAAAGRGVVVANGAEGEPASSKDRALLTHAPHLVLDGLSLAAHAVGATRAYLYAAQDLIDGPVQDALRQRRDAVRVRTVAAADTFVAGQESAVVSVLNGGLPLPSAPRPAVFERGVLGRPTLVQNVETLAQLALVARHGPAWYRAVGTHDEPGTRLLTVSGAVRVPGVYELPGGVPLHAVLDVAGGVTEPVQALLVGGYHGGWVPWQRDTAQLPFTRAALARYDASPGAGVVIALPARRCGVRAGAEIAAYLSGESAAQCGPCRNGLPTIATHLAQLALGRADAFTVREIERVTGLVDGRGACAHPNGTARLVRSTLRTFAAEVSLHLTGRCSASTHAGHGRATA